MTPYIYQIVHVLNNRVLYLDSHVEILNRWTKLLFDSTSNVDAQWLSVNIKKMVVREGCNSNLSTFVCIKLSATGSVSLSLEGTSLYEGYALRSITHSAIIYRYSALAIDAPTSARRASTDFALALAKSKDATCIIQYDGNSIIISANDSPFFAIKDGVVYTPPMESSVERSVAIEAIKISKMRLIEQEISIDQLSLFDELFIFNHMGITSISHCEGELYTTIAVERIAKILNQLCQ